MSPLAPADDRREPSAVASGAEPGADALLIPSSSQFYVVPWEIIRREGEPISLTCMYFDSNGVMVGTQPIARPNAFFLFTQGGPNTVPRLPQPPQPVDVSLFSAVARTLTTACILNSTFNAAPGPGGAPSVMLPVSPGSTRGVILVFRYPATGVVQGLVASSDPEIKNTSGTSDPSA
ncbi:hypothetical protein ACQ859_20535 [Roseateles chitinivorans]|uniref:hypothetical protein n=1 Tax=Roseateles chitinivorans TaxID=2917965 RepID=UPI003D67F5BE